jgi:hypothetical protein
MSTLEMAKAKWARKTAGAGPRWKAGVTGKETSYADGLRSFAGGVGATLPSHWAEGVDATTAEMFSSAIAGKEGKYAEKLREAIMS